MKTPVLIALSLCAFAALPTNETYAQAKEGGGAGHSHFIKVPATAEEIWKEIGNQQTKLAIVVAKNDLGEAHDHGYAIRDLVRALPGKIPAENKAKTEEAAAAIAKHAAAIDKSSAGKAQKTTDANVKKMAAAIDAFAGRAEGEVSAGKKDPLSHEGRELAGATALFRPSWRDLFCMNRKRTTLPPATGRDQCRGTRAGDASLKQ